MSRPARRRTTRIAWTRYCTATWISPVVCCGKSTKHEGTPARVSESCNPAGHASLPSTPVPVTKSTGVRAALVTDSWQNSDDRNLSGFTTSRGSRASAVVESAPSAHIAKPRTTKRLIGVIIGPRGASATRRSQVLGDLQRREFHEALLDAATFEGRLESCRRRSCRGGAGAAAGPRRYKRLVLAAHAVAIAVKSVRVRAVDIN